MAFEEDFGLNDDSAYSLDGRSLIVPDYGDLDDMSSLGGNSKFTYRGDDGAVRYIGDKKIVEKPKGTERSPSKMSSLEKKLAAYQGDPENQDGDSGVDIYEKDEEKKKKKSRCVPQWIAEAPLWLKMVIIISVALLIGAIVLIVIGAKLSSLNLISSSTEVESPIDAAGSPEDSVPQSESISATFYPVTPAEVATSSPSVSREFDTPNATVPVTESTLPPTEPNLETDKPSSAPSSPLSIPVTENKKDTISTDAPTNPPTTATPSAAPTNSPTTSTPSTSPSASPSASPSVSPSASPSYSPTTADPSSAPSDSPTTAPSGSPSTAVPTNKPTAPPTSTPSMAPTQAPTQSPTIQMINFFVMGGRFDGEDSQVLASGLQSLPSFDDNTILVHLGDWNSPYTTSCLEDSYISNVDSYQQSSVPVYFVPGDNEYNDCPNPSQALGLWNQYFLNFETNYWADPSWDVLRQFPNYGENFAFLQREVLFVGINLVGGIVHDENEWSNRHEANLLWIDTTAAKYDGSYTTMVVFAHSDPQIEINQNFFNAFYPMVQRYDEQVIFIHRNLGIDTWKQESAYNGIPNLEVVSVEGSKWPPMWVQIDPVSGTFNIDQSSWYDEYIAKGKLPKTP